MIFENYGEKSYRKLLTAYAKKKLITNMPNFFGNS